MDLEAESTIQVDATVSLDIAQSCNKLLETQKKMAAIDEQLKTLKATEATLSGQTIPNLMHKAGLSLIKLKDGSAVEVKPFYAASIPLSKADEAFTWLRDNGHGDLIKNNVLITFRCQQDNEAKSLVAELREKGHNVKQAEKVESMTLKAFVREQIQDGKNVPADLFGVYVASKTKITTKE
jgi:hypothetical protein